MIPRTISCAAWIVLLAAASCCALSFTPRHEHDVTLFGNSGRRGTIDFLNARSSKASNKVVPVHSMAKKSSKKQTGKSKKKKTAPSRPPTPEAESHSDQFCDDFVKQCYHVALDGKTGDQNIVYACQRNGNKYSSSYSFGCKVNGHDVTPAVLDSLVGYEASTTQGSIIVVTTTVGPQAKTTATQVTTLTPTVTAETRTTTTGVDSQTTTKTKTATTSTTTTALTTSTSTTRTTTRSTETDVSTLTSTRASVSTIVSMGTVTTVKTVPYTTTTTMTVQVTQGLIVPVTTVQISGTPERRRRFKVVAEALLSPRAGSSTSSNDNTKFCHAFQQECTSQCQRVSSSTRYETCQRVATTSQYEQYRLACSCLNKKVETQHALAAVAQDQRLASVSTVSTSTMTVTDTTLHTSTSTLTTTSTSTATKPITTTFTSTVFSTTTLTTARTTVTSTNIKTDRSTTSVVATDISSSIKTTKTTTTRFTSTPTTTTRSTTVTTTQTTSMPVATATTVTSTTITVAAPTGALQINLANAEVRYAAPVFSDPNVYGLGEASNAAQFMAVRDNSSGLYLLRDVGGQNDLLFSPAIPAQADFSSNQGYAKFSKGNVATCGGQSATQAAPFVANRGGEDGAGCEGWSLQFVANGDNTFAVHPTWWDTGATQPMYVAPVYAHQQGAPLNIFPEDVAAMENDNDYSRVTLTFPVAAK